MGMPATGEHGDRGLVVFQSGKLVSVCCWPTGVCLLVSIEHDVPRWFWEIKDAGNRLVRESHAGEAQGHRAVLCHEDIGEAEGQWAHVLFCCPSLWPWELDLITPSQCRYDVLNLTCAEAKHCSNYFDWTIKHTCSAFHKWRMCFKDCSPSSWRAGHMVYQNAALCVNDISCYGQTQVGWQWIGSWTVHECGTKL